LREAWSIIENAGIGQTLELLKVILADMGLKSGYQTRPLLPVTACASAPIEASGGTKLKRAVPGMFPLRAVRRNW